jgi:hypothetical protein
VHGQGALFFEFFWQMVIMLEKTPMGGHYTFKKPSSLELQPL